MALTCSDKNMSGTLIHMLLFSMNCLVLLYLVLYTIDYININIDTVLHANVHFVLM